MKNKRGSVFLIVMYALLIAGLAAMALLYLETSEGAQNLFDALPAGVDSAVDVFMRIVAPVAKAIYFVVAPAGQDENVQVIAFSIFLLLFLIGNKSLRTFLGEFTSLVASGIIGVIAARSLTATILEETAIAASPIAAASLVIGFLPIFALSKNIDKWGFSQLSKLVVFTIVGVVYFLIFRFAFNATNLGIVYGAGIVVLGAIQMIAPYYAKTAREREGLSMGRYMAGVEHTIQTTQAMQGGARQAGGQAGNPALSQIGKS